MDMLLTWGEVFTVVLTGIVIVFIVLIILIAVVWAYGTIFHTINKRKADKLKEKADKQGVVSELTVSDESPNVTETAEFSETGIPGSVVAAITAAVAAFTGGKGVVTGIKKSRRNTKRRSTEWAYAGTLSAMKNFNRTGR